MKPRPRNPKLLPWLARKAGISDPRAEVLWHEAERWAARQSEVGSADYFRLAVDRLLHLVAAESLRADAASFGWRPWARGQARLWAASMQAMHEVSALGARGWRLLDSVASRRQQLPGWGR